MIVCNDCSDKRALVEVSYRGLSCVVNCSDVSVALTLHLDVCKSLRSVFCFRAHTPIILNPHYFELPVIFLEFLKKYQMESKGDVFLSVNKSRCYVVAKGICTMETYTSLHSI
jgi:hypothetical protein